MAAEKNRPNPASTTTADMASRESSPSSGAQQSIAGSERETLTGGTPDERRRKVAEAAYYRAERRGFAPGSEDADWLDAEQEIGGWAGSIKVDELNKCLRSELSAIETYEQALEKNRAQYGQDEKYVRLSQILGEHRNAATQLRIIIEQQGATPSTDSGAWGAWSKTVMGAAKLFGDKAALKALKEGEESGLKEYERIARDAGASTENVVSSFIRRQQAHIDDLDGLIEAA
jgi:hypothetical protein